MSKWILVLLFVVMIFPAQSLTGQTADVNQKRWGKAFALRVQVIEQKYGIKFDSSWKPTLVFEIPDDIPRVVDALQEAIK